MTLYIREQNSKLDELAYYGPFEESEIDERLNDAFSNWMANGLANIDAVLLSPAEVSTLYINPRSFWMSQLETLDFVDETYKGRLADQLGRCYVCQCPLTKNGCENVSQHDIIRKAKHAQEDHYV